MRPSRAKPKVGWTRLRRVISEHTQCRRRPRRPKLALEQYGLARTLWGGPQWARLELALGLELHVRGDASTEVMELARRVRELCAR